MKVLFVITGLGMGGAENQVVNLADKFASKGHQVTIAYMLQPALVQPKNPSVNLVWLGGTKDPVGMLKALINLVRLINRIKPDVVHSHMYHANMLSRAARLFAKMPRLICTAHNTNEGGQLRMISYRLSNWLADAFTNVSDDAVKAFEQNGAVAQGKMQAITNGIDTDFFQLTAQARQQLRSELKLEDKKVFIAIGRFNEQKDYPNLLNAFAKLVQSTPNTHLLIVGDGELRADIGDQINSLELSNNVTLLGIRRDIPQLLSAADIFVLSSAWEGFGLVVAEAMACQRIAIGTDSGGVAQVIGDAGFLVPPKDSAVLAQAMIEASNMSDKEAQELGEKARKRIIEHFSLNATVAKWLEIYGIK